MTADEFRNLVEGRTVYYSLDGEFYGAERFYAKDRSTWRNPSGSCEQGNWWEQQHELCFRYGVVSCWVVYEDGGGERYALSRSGLKVDFDRIDDKPFLCEGDPVS